jgi:hypothetical protein
LGGLFDNREVTNEKLTDIDIKVDNISSDLSIIKMITTKNWTDIDFLKKAK